MGKVIDAKVLAKAVSETMRENDPVRQFLESAQFCDSEVQECKQKADELEAKCSRLTAQINAMPGGGGSDQNDLLAAYADARTKELEAAKEAEEQRERVKALIARINKPLYREILTLRYLSYHSWNDVRKRLRKAGYYYSERNLYYLHERALEEAQRKWESLQ